MKPKDTKAAASEMLKVSALNTIPLLAIEPPRFLFLAIGNVLRDFFTHDIEKHYREFPDDMDKSCNGHGLPFLLTVSFDPTSTDIDGAMADPVDHSSMMIAHFSKIEIWQFACLEF